jgi:hypothetical protein
MRASTESVSPRAESSPRTELSSSSSSNLSTSTNSSSRSASHDGSNDYAKLFAEKKDLQIKLNQFQQEFERVNGRKIMYEEDKAPIAAEYARYKQVKQLLQDISPSAQAPSNAK